MDSQEARSAAYTGLAYEFSLLRDIAENRASTPNAYTEALDKIEDTERRMRAALEDIAAGRREFTLTGDHDFNYVESFWFLVKLAEGVVGDA